ncbi:MAG: hypothetical protein IJU10_03150, partial [Clostridia bacterium]|nr:hypothetical protein [Clostridia bacterium]
MKKKSAISQQQAAYLRKERGKTAFTVLMQLFILVVFFLVWELLASNEIIDSFIFSSPSKMWASFRALSESGELWRHATATLAETVVGFLSATAIGLVIAVILWLIEPLRRILEPYIVVLNALPKIALGPIIIIWVGAGKGAIIVMAILISVTIWAGLISQDETLTREKTFTDVNVNISGTDTMKRNGYIVVSDLSDSLGGVTAVAAVPQMQYERAEASAYNIRVDLSRISGTGEQDLKLQSSTSSIYGRVSSISPESVKVQVEDFIYRYRIPVSVTVTGEVPTGWYMSTPSVDPPLVAVSGPRSLVNSISRARVFLNTSEMEWTEGTTALTGEL